tara:strand:- start:4737 stop:8135 length:3399 start_codon:yes stop_codon:yes gene_type:complete
MVKNSKKNKKEKKQANNNIKNNNTEKVNNTQNNIQKTKTTENNIQENFQDNIIVKSCLKNENNNLYCTDFNKQVIYLQNVIRKTILSVNKYKTMDIISANELNTCIYLLENLFDNLNILINSCELNKFEKLNNLINEFSNIIKNYGTEHLDDLFCICLGDNFLNSILTTDTLLSKYEIMRDFVHPIYYKVLSWKNEKNKEEYNIVKKSRIIEDFMIVDMGFNFDCFDLSKTSKSFQTKVYGLKFCIQNINESKTLIIYCVVDDIMLNCLNYNFIVNKLNNFNINIKDDNQYKKDIIDEKSLKKYIETLTLKELLIYNNNDLYERYIGYINQVNLIKQNTISLVTKDFLSNELYGQRTTIIQLLLKSNEHEYQYLAYLLYDLLTNDSQNTIDTQEQTLLYDSLPWNVKKYFRDAMKQTVTYTNNLSNYDTNKIPLEQQICLMKVNDSVKEKAMVKLKEIKAKAEDSGSKARQYLDGLLKIPFSIYREEQILNIINNSLTLFYEITRKLLQIDSSFNLFEIKNTYSSIEMYKYLDILKNNMHSFFNNKLNSNVKNNIAICKKKSLLQIINFINSLIKNKSVNYPKIIYSNKSNSYLLKEIYKFLDFTENNNNILLKLNNLFNNNIENNLFINIDERINTINRNKNSITEYMNSISTILDKSVHGHDKAKKQIEIIIGQWINGEKNGYCFGFEGPPGVGKTSLAKKGIAKCLKDNNNEDRPFAFIAIGGSSNGSTLDGHNYTYVGSTWGRIVDILIENKCMNPIIFIDELDKISKTEHGKEIIGILTHLIDPTQNDGFQDKYFSGIDLDLSKALFIFSYNDVDNIDKVLLDRIHRIKFQHLSLQDKLVVTKQHILPEIFQKMGLIDIIHFTDDVLKFIILEYTCEPGVRKLKEILFEIIGSINLDLLKNNNLFDIPLLITIDDIKYNYLKDTKEIKEKLIHNVSNVGIINGLWANALGIGGVLPIEACFYPSNNILDLKLTGMQGDVMKESMDVAKTLSFSLIKNDKLDILNNLEQFKNKGIHIHVPEGSTPKDGPSAGTAITIVIYSLLTNKKIKNNIAITGEICLHGNITAIGGLDIKILGGIRAGVKTFIFPKENDKEYRDFIDKYKNNDIINNIEFIQVDNIYQVLDIVFI